MPILPYNLGCIGAFFYHLTKFLTFNIQLVFRTYELCLDNSFSLERTATIKWKMAEEEGTEEQTGRANAAAIKDNVCTGLMFAGETATEVFNLPVNNT